MNLFPEPALEDGESVRNFWRSNHTQSQFRAVGGRLYLTSHRLVFEPHVADASLGGRRWSLPFSQIAGVRLQPAEPGIMHLFDGGMRTRLRIETQSGTPEFFVVEKPEEVLRVITEALALAPVDRHAA